MPLALMQTIHHSSSHGSGPFDWILHSFIWAAMNQTARFLFHEFPVLGWVGAAVVGFAAVAWFLRRHSRRR